MTADTIRVFQIDDWAYVAAKSPEDAAAFVSKEYDRPEDQDERELEEVNLAHNAKLDTFMKEFILSGKSVPALIAIDGHYA